MQLKTILNRVTNYKSFVVGKVRWVEEPTGQALEIELHPRANARPLCSECGKACPGYDRASQPRRFEFIPLWMIPVYLVYWMRRVDCPRCGVKVERVPWAEGKSPMTTEYRWFLARWAKRMCWKDVAIAFRISWDRVGPARESPAVSIRVCPTDAAWGDVGAECPTARRSCFLRRWCGIVLLS